MTTSAPSCVDQLPADRDHAGERILACSGLGDAHLQRALAGEALGHTHLPQVAHVAADRPGRDGDHPEPVAAGERGRDRAFGDAEHGPVGALAAHLQARIAVAGDDEGIGRVVRLDRAPQRQHDLLDILLAFDAERAFGERGAADGRPAGESQRRQRRVHGGRDGRI